ncbi:MAG: hypothetical protein ACWGQW_04305 [bacterium]
MARIVFEEFDEDGSGIREFDDGTEEVFFSEAQWERMMSDPAFGYVCRVGHPMSDADHRFGGCLTCEHMMDAEGY